MSDHDLEKLLDDVSDERVRQTRMGLESLTLREREVLKSAIAGNTAIETAETLGLALRTIELYRTQILAKLRVKNLTQAVRMIALALLHPPM